ncbi:MAG: hypothetical protein D6795_03270 [Deltaproteobacteria bacterium]|nr:MAG: hypothetical protein D6795_03270 [Deltaproteobacteria bacterium]
MGAICGIFRFRSRRPVMAEELSAMAGRLAGRLPFRDRERPVAFRSGPLGLVRIGGNETRTPEGIALWDVERTLPFDPLSLREDPPDLRGDGRPWALASWDGTRLTLGRDPFGIRSLYVARTPEGMLFASDVSTLLGSGVTPRLSLRALYHYLRQWTPEGSETFFEGVERLPPGAVRTFPHDEIGIYVHREAESPAALPERGVERLVRERLTAAFEKRTAGLERVGIELSGGLDSSILALLAVGVFPGPIETASFTFGTAPAYDETPFVDLVRSAFPPEHRFRHHTTVVTPRDVIETLPVLLERQEEPGLGPSLLAHLLSCRAFDREIRVIVGGYGADEGFLGHFRYTPHILRHLWRHERGGWWAGVRLAGRQLRALGVRETLRKIRFRRHRIVPRLLHPDLRAHFPGEGTPGAWGNEEGLGTLLHWEVKTYLSALLSAVDRLFMSEGFSLEAPFLDLLPFARTLPVARHIAEGWPKSLLRKAFVDLLPPLVATRLDARGVMPLGRWFRGPLREFLYDHLGAASFRARGIFDPRGVERLLERHEAGLDLSGALWSLLCVELWSRIFLDRR